MAALITLMASWKIGHRGWTMVGRKLNSGVQVSILPSEWWLWQETKEDNCFIKGVITITSLLLHEQRAFHHLYLMEVLGWRLTRRCTETFYPAHKYAWSLQVTNTYGAIYPQNVIFMAVKLHSLNTQTPKRLQILYSDVIVWHYGTKSTYKAFHTNLRKG